MENKTHIHKYVHRKYTYFERRKIDDISDFIIYKTGESLSRR